MAARTGVATPRTKSRQEAGVGVVRHCTVAWELSLRSAIP